MYCTRRINDDYTWVGADGRRLAMFEGVFDVPAGISFNSYLLRDEKTVLFDTSDAAVRRTFRENLLHALEGRSLDCVVVHHMEPDHTAELEELVLRFPEVQIYCSAMAKTMMTQFFGPGFQERIHVVKEGDTLCTGRHTLRFIAAPMVHWPEVLMTYDETDRLLLTADAFGCFGALNGRLFADEVDFDREVLDEARRYYQNAVNMDPDNQEYQRALDIAEGRSTAYRPEGYDNVTTGTCGNGDCLRLCGATLCCNAFGVPICFC